MLREKINYNIIHSIIQIGRTQELPETFNPKNSWWQSVLYFNNANGWKDLSIEAHEYYYKGVVLTEKASDRFMGSTTGARPILWALERVLEDHVRRRELWHFAYENRHSKSDLP